ncbi:uncharacterized protein LOC126807648 [Patella vulgata]|uniref:uncharacterized protein LOC126807648 n=1 Tax=Patella vulgata TaxID=6465 RepID=UPI00218061B0|nr:uncharacterized protein LOC126807648 [Patella vulgata]
MEMKASVVLSLLVALLLAAPIFCLPADQGSDMEELEKRPKYMDTREELSVLKDMVYITLQELAEEGKIDPEVLTTHDQKAVVKRMKYMGICMRKTKYNALVPYPCLRQGNC